MTEDRLDVATIKELKEILEDEFYDLVDTYICDTKQKMALLAGNVEQHDHKKIGEIAHSMKGASYNLGANRFGYYCHQLEKDANKDADETYRQHVAKLQDEVICVYAELEKYL